MIKVFISHYQKDALIASQVRRYLETHRIESYLDVLDDSLSGGGAALTAHLKAEMNKCSDLLVVMSSRTYLSGWVPFEIGMAAHKDLPTVTYLAQDVTLPEYLEFWPRIKYLEQLALYAGELKSREMAKIAANESMHRTLGNFSRHLDSVPSTEDFYASLKRKLR